MLHDTIPFVHYETLSCQIRAHIIVKNLQDKGAVLVNMRDVDQQRRERLAQIKADMLVDDIAVAQGFGMARLKQRAARSQGLSMLLGPQAD